MKRVSGLVELSRRDFCAFTAVGAALGIALHGCVDSGGAVQTGGLDGTGNGHSPDAGSGSVPGDGSVPPGDGSVPPGDAGVTATCSGTYTDVGAASTYTLNTPKYVSAIRMFVVKDSGGFYALTARCPHEGVTVTPTGSKFHCNAHGADFTYNGAFIDGPTNRPLQHYAMCTLANGNLGVESTMTVAATVRMAG